MPLFILAAAPAAVAQSGPGVRAGVSGNPDQFYVGVHYDTGPLVDRLSFRPNVEVGVGDDQTALAINVEFAYWLAVPRRPLRFYVGGGPALNVYRYHGDRTDAQPGFNVIVGVAHRGGLFAEVKVGLIDSPDVKFGVGYTFH